MQSTICQPGSISTKILHTHKKKKKTLLGKKIEQTSVFVFTLISLNRFFICMRSSSKILKFFHVINFNVPFLAAYDFDS